MKREILTKRGDELQGQEGMASIVVVSVLIIILSLISIGFVRLINRTVSNTANRQFSAQASYAAQSAINDVASYLKRYAQANPNPSFLPRSTKCSGDGTLIGSSTNHGPFWDASNLSGDGATQYTCLLLDPTPTSLVYNQVLNLKSQVVKVNTSAAAGALDKLMISWRPSDSQINGYPTSAGDLTDETTWNSSTPACKDPATGTNASCVPMLRLTIYPVGNGELLSSAQAQSKTVFLYPQSPSGNVPVKYYTDTSGDSNSFIDGSLIPIPCTQTIGAGSFNPTTNSDYNCNVIIGSLAGAIAPATTDSVYLRLTPIYNQADIKIQANDKFGDLLNFIGDQAVIDATAQTGGVAKRLKAWVDTSSIASNSAGIDTNVSSHSDSIPEQSIRSANALCKREVQTTPSLPGFPAFVNFDDPDSVCHDTSNSSSITNPVPELTLSITGRDGSDSGKTVDSEANNPDSPQNPVQQGTVFIDSSATINWNTRQATSCTATQGMPGWPGEKLASVSGPDNVGSGNQTFGGITSVTEFDLVCSRPNAPSNTPTKKVFAWPPPRITDLSINPNPVPAGSAYSINWASANATRCSLAGSWPDTSNTSTSASESDSWPINDNTSTRTYTVTCFDPINRSATRTITLSPVGAPTVLVVHPSCTASIHIQDNGNATGDYVWSGNCPGGYFMLSTTDDFNSGDPSKGCWVGGGGVQPNDNPAPCSDGGAHLTDLNNSGPGTYCAGFRSGMDPWGWIASDYNCGTVTVPPIHAFVGTFTGLQGPARGCDGDSNHFWCDELYYGATDDMALGLTCILSYNGTREDAITSFGSPILLSPPRSYGFPTRPTGTWTSECWSAYSRHDIATYSY